MGRMGWDGAVFPPKTQADADFLGLIFLNHKAYRLTALLGWKQTGLHPELVEFNGGKIVPIEEFYKMISE